MISDDGEQLGILETREALLLAENKGLDLVEVSPNSNPPVCKIMDYGKYKYEEQKKKQASKKKQTTMNIKEIKLRPNTDVHDLQFKTKHIRRFLEHRDKAKITVQFRGREMMHLNRGKEILDRIVREVADVGVPEGAPKKEGRFLSVILQPK